MKFLKQLKKQDNIGYLFILPALVLFFIFGLLPSFRTFKMAFYQGSFLTTKTTYVGWENFIKLFHDDDLGQILKNTILFTVITVFGKVGLGVLLANFVATHVKGKFGKFIMESSLFMPIVIPMSVVTLVFSKMYDTEFGSLNSLIKFLGGTGIGWLTDERIALYSAMIVDIYKGIGFFFIVALVAIRDVPKSYYEAAEIEGASKACQFFKITLPLIGNTLVFLFITAFLSSFQVFDVVYLLLDSQFGNTKITLSVYMYQQAFFYNNIGYASALAILIFIIVMIVTLGQLLFSKLCVYRD